MSTLYFYPELDGDDVYVAISLDDAEDERTLEGQREAIVERFAAIYNALETQDRRPAQALAGHVRALSEALIEPFAAHFRAATAVRVVLSEELAQCAFDLLELDEKPLFLMVPVSYVLDDEVTEYDEPTRLRTGLILADLTADPEKACEAVHQKLPQTEYFEMDEDSYARVESLDACDLLLVSGHGSLEEDGSGELALWDEDDESCITSDEISELETTLVYFDSCQMGVNWDFIGTFYEEGSARYYVAPIISNDAGDSSTRTMSWFFSGVMQHGDVPRALFDARAKLFAHYRREGLSPIAVLNKAFAFRVYEFDNE